MASNRKQSTSKAELKRALVTQRLAMLQPNIHHNHHISPVAIPTEKPIHYQSGSESPVMKWENSSNSIPDENCPSPLRDIKDAVLVSSARASQKKCASHKRSMVISDNESDEAGRFPLLVQPTKKERTKRKRVTSVASLNKEIRNDFDNPKNQRIKIAEAGNDPSVDKSSSVMKQAEEVQANLPAEYPSFVKMMLPSHVSRVFWLHLPTKFCKDHLPICDSVVELVDEVGKIYECKYLVNKSGLSGGWRAFSLDHELKEGDVVVFQLIAVTTFKVYIVRKGSVDEFEGVLGLLRLDDCRCQEISENIAVTSESNPPLCDSPCNDSDHLESEVLDGICFSDVVVNFEVLKGFSNFNIIVDGLVIDSKFSEANRKKYYELCCCQKCFLHEQLLKGLNCNLVIGIILETINIADAIRACTSSTSVEDLWTWEKTLKGFELLGMKVDFLQSKLNQMLDMANENNGLEKCVAEQACASDKVRALENKLAKFKVTLEKMHLEVEAEMTATTRKLQSKLKEAANTL
ncbi:hypothetical protein RND81_13G219000 [Saponaria officinalis]|uniref:TF-B3 domain-containing protein n=1 Tax=Saponaria officinalis TaxID=3572 RepID=A0AAW1H3U9_SAPOF